MKSDHVNPIVIKELRQGLKSRSFLLSFVGLQVVMIMSMFIYITSAVNPRGDLEGADVFFWAMLNLLFLVLMPLRGFQALYEEITGKTLELLFLTRMNSWKISFGKWIALVIQALLMVCAILPYFVLRYFLGSIDITRNLFMLGGTLLASLVLMAVGVGLSCITSRLLRVLVFLGGALGLWVMGVGAFAFFRFGAMVSGPRTGAAPYPEFWTVMAVLTGAILAMAFFIEYGASRIAPPAENHARWKRLIAVLTLVLFAAVSLTDGNVELLLAPLFFLIPLLVGALCEPLYSIPGAYKSRYEVPVFTWLLLPGWPSGYLFTICMLLAHGVLALIVDFDDDIGLFFLILFNILIIPYVLIRCLKWLQVKPLLSYLGYQLAALLFAVMFMVLNEIGLNADGFTQFMGVILPTLGLLQLDNHLNDGIDVLHGLMTLALLIASFILTLPGLSETARLRNLQPDVLPRDR